MWGLFHFLCEGEICVTPKSNIKYGLLCQNICFWLQQRLKRKGQNGCQEHQRCQHFYSHIPTLNALDKKAQNKKQTVETYFLLFIMRFTQIYQNYNLGITEKSYQYNHFILNA